MEIKEFNTNFYKKKTTVLSIQLTKAKW